MGPSKITAIRFGLESDKIRLRPHVFHFFHLSLAYPVLIQSLSVRCAQRLKIFARHSLRHLCLNSSWSQALPSVPLSFKAG